MTKKMITVANSIAHGEAVAQDARDVIDTSELPDDAKFVLHCTLDAALGKFKQEVKALAAKNNK